MRPFGIIPCFMILLVSGCANVDRLSTSGPQVQHIVVIMQENRSFDNLFNGYPGADTVQIASDFGTIVPLQPLGWGPGVDLDHAHHGWWVDWHRGEMSGFGHAPNHPFYFVPQDETLPLWTLAQRYVLSDRMFASNTGPSFAAHQYMIAGQSDEADNTPNNPAYPKVPYVGKWGCDAPFVIRVTLVGPNGTDLPGPYPCFDYETIADVLDAAGISWKYYAPKPSQLGYVWSAFDAIHHIRFGPDWTKNVISPDTQVFSDIQNGTLPQVSWVIPDFAYSDHAGAAAADEGPSWVATVVNAIGASQYWNSTVILIAWDDWGGWYDHVSPPQIDNMGLGFRVPLIVVSPFAKHGYISHQTHEFGSFLRFTEGVFNLPSLGTRDAISDDLSDCFDFTQTPQPYIPIQTKYDLNFFLSANPSDLPPDDD